VPLTEWSSSILKHLLKYDAFWRNLTVIIVQPALNGTNSGEFIYDGVALENLKMITFERAALETPTPLFIEGLLRIFRFKNFDKTISMDCSVFNVKYGI